MTRFFATAVIVALLVLGLVPAWQTSTAQAVTFVETFDGNPAGPAPFVSPRWDVAVHARDHRDPPQFPVDAHHGTDCGPYPALHPTNGEPGTHVFQCRDHVMTSTSGGGYAVIYLTPNHMADFSAGEAVVRFDVSTHRSSERDWLDVWLSPFEDNLQLPLQPGFPDLQGPPRRAVHVLLGLSDSSCVTQYINGSGTDLSCLRSGSGLGYESSLNNIPGFPGASASRRDTIEVHISQTHIKVGMPAYNWWWADTPLPTPLDWNQGVVQIGHHAYSPEKGSFCPNGPCGDNTWHWDNVNISPATPFTIIKGDKRFVAGSGGNVTPEQATVRFSTPAPAGSFLRFTAWGPRDIEYSTDGGATWRFAAIPFQRTDGPPHVTNYWTPVPAGTVAVMFRSSSLGWPWDGTIKDINIWALQDLSLPPPVPSATAEATPTSTPPALPSATPTIPSPSPSPTATATSSPSPSPSPPAPTPSSTPTPMSEPSMTPTPEPTATPTVPPPPVCQIRGRINGVEDWFTVDCSLLMPVQ